jgi:hypothetical protein
MQPVLVLFLATVVSQASSVAKTDTTKPDAKRNESLRKELLERVKEDQVARRKMIDLLKKSPTKDPAEPKKQLDTPEVKKLGEIDKKNTAWMKQVVKKHGWPGKSLVGTDGANAAWLLVQHADRDREFQKECLKLIEAAFKRKEVTGQELAYLTDRVLVGEKKKQIYGTQFVLKSGRYVPQPIEDEANVDRRRNEMGLQSFAEYAKALNQLYVPNASGKR